MSKIKATFIALSIFGGWFLICIIATACQPFKDGEYKQMSNPIYSFEVKDKVSGTFILGCGRIKDKEYYFFYEKWQGIIKRKNIDVDDVDIIEYNGEPKIEFIGMERICDDGQVILFIDHSKKYRVYLPIGFITKNI